MLRAVASVVHENADPGQAYELYEELSRAAVPA
jgi:hypothetical protein